MIEKQFHVPPRYFLSHSVGCQPVTLQAALEEAYIGVWKLKGGHAWESWMPALEIYQSRLGSLLDVEAELICPQINVSSALTKILHALPVQQGKQTIVCTQDDFPSMGYVFSQAARLGYTLRFIEGDVCQTENWARAMDETVAVMFITHVLSNRACRLPVADLCQLARSGGAVSIVDVAQSAGIIPVEPVAWDVDYVIGTGVKFLCAGPGAAFLYARRSRLAQARPLDVGWFSHEDPFEMDIHDFRFAGSAMRFFGGTPSPAPLIAASAAFTLWSEIGLQRVYSRVQAHLDHLQAALPSACLVSPRHAAGRGATLIVAPPSDPVPFERRLQEAGIQFDQRKQGYRFSVHAYTSEQDIEALASCLQTLG